MAFMLEMYEPTGKGINSQPIYLDIETYFTKLNDINFNDPILTCQTKFLELENTELFIASKWTKTSPLIHFKETIEYVKKNPDTCIVGSNLKFEFGFYKSQIDPSFDPFTLKHIDIKDTCILINNLQFYKWNEILGKTDFSKKIPELYNSKQFALIENYIQKEFDDFYSVWIYLRKLWFCQVLSCTNTKSFVSKIGCNPISRSISIVSSYRLLIKLQGISNSRNGRFRRFLREVLTSTSEKGFGNYSSVILPVNCRRFCALAF